MALFCAAPSVAQLLGTCEAPTGEAYLEANNVRAWIQNTGGLFYRDREHVYNVPRLSNGNSIFAGGLWIAGQVGGQLRAAASRVGPWEYWSGPLDEEGNPPDDCSEYDRVFSVNRSDIEDYESGGIATPDLLDWPTGLGAPTLDAGGSAIDLMDLPLSARKDRAIDLAAGERPAIMGDQSLWWVMNDRGNVHESTRVPPLGVEVHGFAFAAGSSVDAVNDATLYKYRVFNRSAERIDSLYIGLFFDTDLGDAGDDWVGSDTLLGMGFTYNADDFDDGLEGYGTRPPALGVQLLEGPLVEHDGLDNDRDGTVDEARERLGMTNMMYFNGGGGVTEDPRTGTGYYRYLQSKWKNGSPLLFGGNGFDQSYEEPVQPTNFAYPGDPLTGAYWSEVNMDGNGLQNSPADRRFIVSTGPFTLAPGEQNDFSFSIVWARGEDHLDSVRAMKEAAEVVRAAYETGYTGFPPGLPPQEAVVLLSPADRAQNQPVDPVLHWTQVDQEVMFHVQLATPHDMEAYSTQSAFLQLDSLLVNASFYWRVRVENVYGFGAWSDWSTFSTNNISFSGAVGFKSFLVVQNADGPVDPPVTASAPWRGFPGDGSRPSDRQQAGDGKWIIATGMSGGCSPVCGDYASFLSRSVRNGWSNIVPYDFEIRFTGTSLHYDRFGAVNGGIVTGDDLPFEIWNIGNATPGDASDDFRMIPAGLDGEGDGWGITNRDHNGSAGSNDPETDWVYWFNPADTSRGTAGYDAWAADAVAGGDPGGDFLGEEVFSRMVFFNWNGGSVPGPYNQDLPEEGTIFRIETTATPPAPALSAPGNMAIVPSGDILFFWQTVSVDSPRLMIAKDADFSIPVTDIPDVSSGVPVRLLEEGLYFWKLVSRFGMDSETWRFTVAQAVGIGGVTDNVLPISFEVYDLFPNPTSYSAVLRYQLPHAQKVTIEVFDLLGRRVMNVFEGFTPSGIHRRDIIFGGLAAGTYYVRVRAETESGVKVVALVN